MTNDPIKFAAARRVAGDLRVLIGQLRRRLRDQMRPGDLSWSQVSVLGRLERDGPATVTSLARSEGMRPQSMGAIVAALEAAGLITGAPDPRDGRQTILSPTPSCRALIKASRDAREDWLSQAIETKLTPAEQETLVIAIDLLKRLL